MIDSVFRRVEFVLELGCGVVADIRVLGQMSDMHVFMIHRKENVVIIIRAEKKCRFIDQNDRCIVSCSGQITFPADESNIGFDSRLLGDGSDDTLLDTGVSR